MSIASSSHTAKLDGKYLPDLKKVQNWEPFLTTSEQDIIRSKLNIVIERSHLSEKLFLDRGGFVAFGASIANGLVFFRASFRGFSLARFNKFRLTGLVWTGVGSLNSAILHEVYVKGSLFDYYRPESALHYGMKSLIWNVVGFTFTGVMSVGSNFIGAYRYGIIVLPPKAFSGTNRKETFKIFTNCLRPFRKSLAVAFVLNSLFMFYVGVREYRDSVYMLGKLGRKTLSLNEGPM